MFGLFQGFFWRRCLKFAIGGLCAVTDQIKLVINKAVTQSWQHFMYSNRCFARKRWYFK